MAAGRRNARDVGDMRSERRQGKACGGHVGHNEALTLSGMGAVHGFEQQRS